MSTFFRVGLLRSTMIAAAISLGGAAALLTPSQTFAQDYTTGSLEGVVYGENGSPASGVEVTLRSTDRGFARTTITGSNGMYRFLRLPIGGYEVGVTGAPDPEMFRIAVGATTRKDLAASGNIDEIVSGGLGTIGQGLTSLGDRINNRQKKKYDDEVKGHESTFESILAQAIDEEDLLRLVDEHSHNEEDQHHYSNEANLIQEYRNNFINQAKTKAETGYSNAQARASNATAFKTELGNAELERQAKLADERNLFRSKHGKRLTAINYAYFEQNEELGDRLTAELLEDVDHSLFSPQTISTIFGGVEKSTTSGYRVVEGIEKGNRQRSDTAIRRDEEHKSSVSRRHLEAEEVFRTGLSDEITVAINASAIGDQESVNSSLSKIIEDPRYKALTEDQKISVLKDIDEAGKTGRSFADTHAKIYIDSIINAQTLAIKKEELRDTEAAIRAENHVER